MGTSHSSGASISLDELVALTDELAALSRAGVPFETGLAQTARELSRRPGQLAAKIAEKLRQGESLSQVLAAEPEIFSPAYRAVVEAGIRSGRISVALEGLAESSQRTAELKRATRAALVYPLFIAFAAYALFIFSLIQFHPLVGETYAVLRIPESRLNRTLSELGRTAGYWGPALALAAIVIVVFWSYRSARITTGGSAWWRRSPFNRLRQSGSIATFADVLALLIEQQVPLDQSIVLAADASGDRELNLAAQHLAEEIGRGGTSQQIRQRLAGFPPLLGWLLANSGQQSAPLVAALRSTAETYRRHSLRLEMWLRWYLPMVLTALIGGIAVALYVCSIFVPWSELIRHGSFAK